MKLQNLINNKEHCQELFKTVFVENEGFGVAFNENKYGVEGVVLTGYASGAHSLLTIFEDGVIVAESQLLGEQYIDVGFNCWEVVEKLIKWGYERNS